MKFNIVAKRWPHHHGGWTYVGEELIKQFHNSAGVLFYDWLDGAFKFKQNFSVPWAGILHNTVRPGEDYTKYNKAILCLEKLVKTDLWLDSIDRCVGVYTFSKETTDFISKFVKAERIYHPTPLSVPQFDFNSYEGHVVTIGQWMRRYHSIYKLTAKHRTVIKTGSPWEQDYAEMHRMGEGVEIINYVPHAEYERILCSSLVFLDFYDVAACNVVLECIARGTPVLTNKLPGNIEYLGEDYPLFFSTLEEANEKANDLATVRKGHDYLVSLNKSHLSIESFTLSVLNSSIYQSVKLKRLFL